MKLYKNIQMMDLSTQALSDIEPRYIRVLDELTSDGKKFGYSVKDVSYSNHPILSYKVKMNRSLTVGVKWDKVMKKFGPTQMEYMLYIYQADDEYFYIYIDLYSRNVLYKCDSIDGVVEFINDKLL